MCGLKKNTGFFYFLFYLCLQNERGNERSRKLCRPHLTPADPRLRRPLSPPVGFRRPPPPPAAPRRPPMTPAGPAIEAFDSDRGGVCTRREKWAELLVTDRHVPVTYRSRTGHVQDTDRSLAVMARSRIGRLRSRTGRLHSAEEVEAVADGGEEALLPLRRHGAAGGGGEVVPGQRARVEHVQVVEVGACGGGRRRAPVWTVWVETATRARAAWSDGACGRGVVSRAREERRCVRRKRRRGARRAARSPG